MARLLFLAFLCSSVSGWEMWDVNVLRNFCPGSCPGIYDTYNPDFIVYNHLMYFAANNNLDYTRQDAAEANGDCWKYGMNPWDCNFYGAELWSTDGTPKNTKMIVDIWEGWDGSNPRYEGGRRRTACTSRHAA